MDTNEFLKTFENIRTTSSGYSYSTVRPRMLLGDGFHLSVQASHTHYCMPREDAEYPYWEVEVGYPSADMGPEFAEFAEEPDKPTATVYGYVPVSALEKFFEAHGGLVGYIIWSEENKEYYPRLFGDDTPGLPE